ncbi:MAG: membrane dipeptidase [Acidobacteria bacterium]|nr:membrane dipeptidase [Acidobacteriota bacterium]
MKTVFLGLCLAVPILAVSDKEVAKVHRSALLIDTHNDVPIKTLRGMDIGARNERGHTDIARLKQGGVGAVFFAVYVAPEYATKGGAAHHALEVFDSVRRDIVDKHSGDFVLATSAREIEQAHKRRKIAALMGVEGGHAIEDSVRVLRTFYDLGARYMTLTHANTNNWADSSGDLDRPEVKHHNGLTPLGREIVTEMNRLGMMVDVSHVSDKTFWDVLETSRAPVLATHSNCRALSNIPRNLTDEMIVALTRRGGQVNMNFGCEFLSQKSADASAWINPGRPAGTKMPRATVQDVVAHIDRVVKLAGIDHVGIGTDFDGISCTPQGVDDPGQFPNLTRALLEHGYKPADIRKIYGGNMLRLMRAVEQARQR